jgi:RNA polymerase sigma factor (sigma-70 family)
MRDDPVVIALVDRAAAGDEGAWNEIVERYAPLVWSICARYQLGYEEAHDVGQTVWLLLVEKIGSLREPAALPGWLGTTTQRECFRVLRVERRHEHTELPPEDQMPPDPDATMIEEEVLTAERGAAFRAAFDTLPSGCRALLSMLASDPPPGYTEISATLGVAVGSIGPMRARCLDRLRRSPQVASLADDTAGIAGARQTRSGDA